jgi:ferrous iron transport protein B
VRRAGTVILGISILLWFLATYPKDASITQNFEAQRQAVRAQAMPGNSPAQIEQNRNTQLDLIDKNEAGAKLRHSFAGKIGRAIEPAIRPLGFDWQMGIGIVSSFAAREVFVSTMSLVYNVGKVEDKQAGNQSLAQTMRSLRHPDGTPVYTTLVALSLMVFYVFALQCVSTVAVVRRETNGWKWPLFQWAYMGILAWVLAFLTYQGGRLLGWS